MRYVEACANDIIGDGTGWYSKNSTKEVSIFLAGGITGCYDWQDEARNFFSSQKNNDNLVLLNPRRNTFDFNDPNSSYKQIEWEYHHLKAADAVLFWFPSETLCPITLFEYGKCIAKNKLLFVGCNPEYARFYDLLVQTRFEKPSQKINTSLLDLLEQTYDWYKSQTPTILTLSW